jgi:hypothetical protein
MAEVRLKPAEKGKAKKRAGRKRGAGTTPVRGLPKKAVSRKAATTKAEREDGVEKLKKAADKVLGRNSAKLANLLLDKAVEGKLEGARLLVKLAEGKKPPVKPKRTWDGKTYAEMLASEPEWVEPEPVDFSDLDEGEKGTEALASQRVSEFAS